MRSSARAERDVVLIVLLTLAVLLPFINKAFHIDDPLFIWTARQIAGSPSDPFGFTVNWFGTEAPMAEVMRNPPLGSYYLALAGALTGWSEASLHAWFLLPAIFCGVGIYALAR